MKVGTAPGAQNGGNIALTVLFDSDFTLNCAGASSIDFVAMGQSACEQAFNGIAQECEYGSTSWPGYDASYPSFGGVAGAECGLWSVYGQSA